MSRLLFMIIIVLSFSCSHSEKTNESDKNTLGVDIEVHKKTFDNGLRVLVVENDKLPIFSYYTFYEVGGKFETKGITGASHYLEHMMFKGAKKYGPNMFDKLIEGNGGTNNAYTSNDLTVYYEQLPSEHINTVIDIEADRMDNLTLLPTSFEKERQVILEERKMRYENSDKGKIYLSMMKAAFKDTLYGTSVIGELDDLNRVTRDQIYNYFKKFYAPNNAVVVVVGDVDADDIFDEIEKRYGEIKSSKGLDKFKQSAVTSKGKDFVSPYFGKRIDLNGTSPSPIFMMAFKGQKLGTRDSYVLDMLSSVLGDGESSFFHKRYVSSQKPTMSGVYASNYTLQDSGVFFIGGQLLRSANLRWAEKDLIRAINKGCKQALTDRNLQKVKNQYLGYMIGGIESNSGLAKFLGNYEVYFKDYNRYKVEMDIYDSITTEEMVVACKKYLTRDNAIFLSIWNKNPKRRESK